MQLAGACAVEELQRHEVGGMSPPCSQPRTLQVVGQDWVPRV